MREIPDALKGRLAAPVTTMARAWRLTRVDGRSFGFTDHDEALTFAGTTFEAASGLSAGEAEAALGLSAGTQEVEGALSSAAISEEDIEAGLYDGARVECFAVDWSAPQAHMLLEVATLGELRRRDGAFTAELRGPEAALDSPRGRLYRRRCDAVLGDARCKVDLGGEGRTRRGVVSGAGAARFEASGLGAIAFDDFAHGLLRMTSGRAAGFAREVAGLGEAPGEGEVAISLVEPLPFAAEAGDAFTLSVGCDKSFSTCRTRFANHLNFRGFPHLPGLDTALGIAKRDGLHDGGPVVL
ncbi:DUF2163 domain-containing protein [Aureimonas populi]|uniref:DUF2163 domain-containing protein n=1 Tax=Aureimonas populi TaxID=1701758 RepID=A0ABW5CLF9_9HYPH|nr:DUF2163 domain-containing protein [Aureimonas populi]